VTPPEGDQFDVGAVRPLLVPRVDRRHGRTASYRLKLLVKRALRDLSWEVLDYAQEQHANTPQMRGLGEGI
jgi:hypothetical protein